MRETSNAGPLRQTHLLSASLSRLAGWSLVAISSAVAGAAPAGTSAEARATGIHERATARPIQEVALLSTSHAVYAFPGERTARTSLVASRRPITGVRTALPIIGRVTGARGLHWLRVMLPGRPNGSVGWIKESGTVLTRTDWRIDVQISRRRVLVYHRGRLLRAFKAIVGAASTPTPRGRFFVEETVRMLPGSAGGPYALALSAHSAVLHEFLGGGGQVAIHGMANLPGAPGTASSHGCVRLSTRSIDWLAIHIEPGVPVSIAS